MYAYVAKIQLILLAKAFIPDRYRAICTKTNVSVFSAEQEVLGRTNHLLSFDTKRTS
jgi:hypothetical protein